MFLLELLCCKFNEKNIIYVTFILVHLLTRSFVYFYTDGGVIKYFLRYIY